MLSCYLLAALVRAFENQFGKACDGHKTRILQIAIGELHAESLLDLGDEFYDLHRGEPSRLEVVCVTQIFWRILADLRSRHEPVCEPILCLFFQPIPSLPFASLFDG